MKRLLFLALLPVASLSYGQITITATDMPVPTGGFNINDMSMPSIPPSPIPGTNITWDLSSYDGGAFAEYYAPETDTFFTNIGVDVNYYWYKSMATDVFAYDVYHELDFTATDVSIKGIYIPYQGFDLSAATGNTGDSMEIPEQSYRLSQPVQTAVFPMTAGTAWHSVSRHSTNFTLTVTPLLDHVPSQHVYYVHRDDSVAGWGRMRVYTGSGPSAWYNVLMDKISYYTVDSFYINGVPADATLLSSFGLSQDQHSDSLDRYEFYRKGSYNYLAQFNYYNDASYTNLGDAGYNTDNLDPSSVGNVNNATYTTVLYPNPVTGNEVNFKISGGNVAMAHYAVYDMTGRLVSTGISNTATELHMSTEALPGGAYVLHVMGSKGENIAREQFDVVK